MDIEKDFLRKLKTIEMNVCAVYENVAILKTKVGGGGSVDAIIDATSPKSRPFGGWIFKI